MAGMNGVMPASNRDLLGQLDADIVRWKEFSHIRSQRADSVISAIQGDPSSRRNLELLLEAGELQSGVSSDLAIATFSSGANLARAARDTLLLQQFVIERAYQYFNQGATHEALSQLDGLERSGLLDENRRRFHSAYSRICITNGAFYSYTDVQTALMDRGLEHARKWYAATPENSPERYFAKGLIYYCEGKSELMASSLIDCVNSSGADDVEYPRALSVLGEYYRERGEHSEVINVLTRATLANLYQSHIDAVSLLRLGENLYATGQLSRAHTYLSTALAMAIEGNQKFNLMRVNNAYLEVARVVDSEKYYKFYVLLAFVILLTGFCVIVLLVVRGKRREVKMLRITEERLSRANLAMETYISKFMNLSSDYIESLEDYNRVCRRKLTAGQTDDLLAYIKSDKVLDEARRKFYDVFDSALFNIFPDFTREVNELLQPDKQIVTPQPHMLTTELRIAALTRLGIDDAAVIARFLGISTNTIYTYRNKLRNRAIDRNTFEDNLHKIGLPRR